MRDRHVSPSSATPSRRRAAKVLQTTLLGLLGVALLLVGLPAGSADWSRIDGLVTDHGFEARTYYRATRVDQRLCPAPFCGGFFVERVNRRKTKCAEGGRAPECHAAIVDLSALGLDPAAEAELLNEFGQKRVLIRGDLVPAPTAVGPIVPTLVARDAWRGVTGTQAGFGRYFGVIPSGIVCITHPCPSLISLLLNSKRAGFLHSLDLTSRSGATPEQVEEGLTELSQGPGLIAFGPRHPIKGPAGTGKELVASEFYTRVAASSEPRACGGFTWPPNPPCADGEFCEQPPGTCLVADLPGTCQVVPEVCPLYLDPVCGCDGVTYGNDCERLRARVALDHPGACDAPPLTCGPVTCAPGTVCCNPLRGICTLPGQACIQ